MKKKTQTKDCSLTVKKLKTNNLHIAVVLAAGNGSRINGYDIPKQFIPIHKKPILFYALNAFASLNYIDCVICVVPKKYNDLANQIVEKYFPKQRNIFIIEGSKNRCLSLANAYKFIKKNIRDIRPSDIVLTHDAARMFLDTKIIYDAIDVASSSKCVANPSIKLNDSVCGQKNKKIVTLSREEITISQTPQTCQFSVLEKIFSKKYPEKVLEHADLCKLAELNKITIKNSLGSKMNFKITNNEDLIFAKLLISML